MGAYKMINDYEWADGYKIKIFNFGKHSVFNSFAQCNSDAVMWIRFMNIKHDFVVSDCYEIMEPYYANMITYNLHYLESGDTDSMIDEDL